MNFTLSDNLLSPLVEILSQILGQIAPTFNTFTFPGGGDDELTFPGGSDTLSFPE